MNLPNYSIGTEAYQDIEKYASSFGAKAVIIGGKKALAAAEDDIKDAIKNSSIEIIDTLWFGGDANHSNIESLKNNETVQNADMLFGVGGGRAIDTVKSVGYHLDTPVFTFPTIASNCAPTTAVCVLYKDNGEMDKLLQMGKPPIHSFANTKIIAEAPIQYIWAGIGDALSKEIESEFSSRGRELSYKNELGVKVVEGCNSRLLEYGEAALESCKNNDPSQELELVENEIIGTTSLTSVLVDNDFNSNAGHAFYYGYTAVPTESEHLHGEVVAYGTLVLLALDNQYELLHGLYNFMDQIELSTTLEQLDIKSEDHLNTLLDKMMTMSDLDMSPYEITREMVVDAINEVEALAESEVNI